MCFSVGASFTASGILAVIGGFALVRAPKYYRALAAIPLLFALQQFAEGVVWMTLTHPLAELSRNPLQMLFMVPVLPIGFFSNMFNIPEYGLIVRDGAIY